MLGRTHIPHAIFSHHLLTKENCAPAPAPLLPTGGASGAIPRTRFALSRGHRSLVMFVLMSYMLISHGPSPPLRMGLWGDIPRHPCWRGPANAQERK